MLFKVISLAPSYSHDTSKLSFLIYHTGQKVNTQKYSKVSSAILNEIIQFTIVTGIIGLHKTFNEHCDCWWPSTVRCLDICRYTDDNFQSLIYTASVLEWLRYNLLKSNTSHTLWSHYLSHCRLYPLLGCTHGKNSFWYRVTSHNLSVNKYGILISLTTHAHIYWMEDELN